MNDDPHDATWFEDEPPHRSPSVWRIAFGAALVLGLTLIGVAVMAQEATCHPRDGIVTQLQDRYGEAQQGAGLTQAGRVVEIWANPETGTWTILVTRPNGVSCAVAAGEAWLEDVASIGRPM